MAIIAQGLAFGVGTALAWAGIGAATGAAAQAAHKRRAAKGLADANDATRRQSAQRRAEEEMFSLRPGTQTGVSAPVLPTTETLNGFTEPSQLPPRFVAIIYQRQFSCSVDVYSEGVVDGGAEGQHWEVINQGKGEFLFRLIWSSCYLSASKTKMGLKTKLECTQGTVTPATAWTMVMAPDQGAGAFFLRNVQTGEYMCMTAKGKLKMQGKVQTDAHKQVTFRFVSAT